MKRYFNVLLLLVVLSSLIYCGRSSDDSKDGILSIYPLENCTLVENVSDYVDSIAFIELKGGVDAFLSYVNKIFIDSDNNFIVWDNSAGIKVFSREGHFLRNIGTKGRGPGEYINIDDMCLTLDGHYLYILQFGAVLKYKISDGSLTKKTTLPQKSFDAICSCTNDGFYLFASNPDNEADFDNEFYALTLFDQEGNLIKEILPRKDYVLSRGVFTRSYDGAAIMRPQEGDNVVYKIREKLEPILKIDFGEKAIPAKYIFNNGNNIFEGLKSYLASNFFKFPVYLQDTESQLFFSAIGPNTMQMDFLYSYESKKGIRWENKNNKGEPIFIMAGGRDFFYTVVNSDVLMPTLNNKEMPMQTPNSKEILTGTSHDKEVSSKTPHNKNTSSLKSLIISSLPTAASADNITYIVKIRFSNL